jgi:hypothetical protein
MRFTQDGMLVKSMDVPDVEATAVPDVMTLLAGVTNTGLVSVGEVNDRLDAKYVEPTDPAVAGIAFSTEDTKKLSTVTKSPEFAPFARTTVVPFVAV